jgi:hypothetical protein
MCRAITTRECHRDCLDFPAVLVDLTRWLGPDIHRGGVCEQLWSIPQLIHTEQPPLPTHPLLFPDAYRTIAPIDSDSSQQQTSGEGGGEDGVALPAAAGGA